jgi:DNA-binding NarL/FixJ family response regulator
MDINMPKMNGIMATSQIKTRFPTTNVIGLSVNAGAENQEAMTRAGASVLITKEAAVQELHQAICDAVKEQIRPKHVSI